jgi:hypothetical protein
MVLDMKARARVWVCAQCAQRLVASRVCREMPAPRGDAYLMSRDVGLRRRYVNKGREGVPAHPFGSRPGAPRRPREPIGLSIHCDLGAANAFGDMGRRGYR